MSSAAGAIVKSSKAEVFAHSRGHPLHPGAAKAAEDGSGSNRALADGEELPYGGGIVVIHTPGHTPGHMSFFLPADHLLISGDALRVESGVLEGPNPKVTPDLSLAAASLRKLLGYPIDRVLCYHGGLSGPGALARL